jgi:hypothetical protein
MMYPPDEKKKEKKKKKEKRERKRKRWLLASRAAVCVDPSPALTQTHRYQWSEVATK